MLRVYAQQSGRVVELTHSIGVGGEGTVFVWPPDSRLVCKVYHDSVLGSRSDLLSRKLRAMLGVAPADPMLARGKPTFAWPQELVCDATHRQRFVGFVMPRIGDSYALHRLYSQGNRSQLALPLDANGHSMEYYVMVTTARNLAEAFRLLHVRGYVMGDVNEDNIRFRTDSTVSLIDNNSFQWRDGASGENFLVSVMKPEYWPADSLELQRHGEALATSHDDFGLAVFLFRLLMNGVHPYNGMGVPGVDPPTLVENIAAGHFPFVPAHSGGLPPPPYAPAFESLPVELRGMFQRCFVEGVRAPSARASAARWEKVLARAQATLKGCQRGHMHFAEARLCPWCELEDALISCGKGHTYYRAEGSCSQCAVEQKRAARRSGVPTPTTPPATVPNPPPPAPQPVVPVPVPAPTPAPAPARPAPVPVAATPAPVATRPPFVFPGFAALLRNSNVLWGMGVLAALVVGLIVGRNFTGQSSSLLSVPKPQLLKITGNSAVNPQDNATLVLIPAGPFQMGGSNITYSPLHTVKLSSYWIYKDLVTVGQYKKYVASMKESGKSVEMPSAPSFDKDWSQDDHPIVNVSWNDAQGYCISSGTYPGDVGFRCVVPADSN